MSKVQEVSVNIQELTYILDYMLDTNKKLQEEGKSPVAISVTGESGIGKTSTIMQIGNNSSLEVVKLNLAQLEELSDLVGYPVRQYQMTKNTGSIDSPNWHTVWIDEPIVEDAKLKGYTATGNSQMGYCPPAWIADKKEGGLLILDDWNR